MATPPDDPSPPERPAQAGDGTPPAQAGDGTRPAQAGDGIVTEIRKDDGRLLLIYRWPPPADAPR